MKQKILLAPVIALLLSVTTKAQIGKGSFTAGGSIGFSSMTQSDANTYKQSGLTINPAFGKAISDNTIAGVDLLFAHSWIKYSGSPATQNGNTYGAGFFMRWYLPVVSRFYIFGQGRAGFDYTKAVYDDKGDNRKAWDAGVFFYPGASFAVNKKIQLEAGFNNLLGIQYSTTKTPLVSGTSETKNFSAGINLNNNQSAFIVGLRLLINNKG